MTHGDLLNAILLALSARGVLAWKNNTGALTDRDGRLVRYGLKGSSDILGVIPPSGKALAIEVKVGRDRLRPEQARFGEAFVRHGGIWVVARSVDDALVAVAVAAGGGGGRIEKEEPPEPSPGG